jgi:serine/threonine protein kinase
MEFLDGFNLADLIYRNTPLHIQDRVSMLLQMAEALLFAHERCILHRDIKPSNILVLSDGSIKVLDFGIARIMDSQRTRLTMPGTLLGTVEYMTPEQLNGSDADARTDIYSLGLVGYELISGRQPFRADTMALTFERIANGTAPPLRQCAPDCPEAIERILHQAIMKDPAQRYQTMQEFVYDLAHVEAGLRRDRASALANEAEKLAAEMGAAAASKPLAKALRLDPLSGKAQALRVALRLRTGDGQELFPSHSPEDVIRERVLAEVEKRTSEHLAAGRVEDAARLIEGGLKRYPSDPTLIRLRSHVQRTSQFKAAPFGPA